MLNVMGIASAAVRGSVVASEGKKLVIADLASIEGRVLAWLAGEEWTLQAYRDYDAGKGADLYCVTYGKAFRVDPTTIGKKDPRRQIGKVMDLFLGYGGGVGAYVTGAATYGIDLEEMAEQAWPTLPGDVVHDAEGFLEWLREKGGGTYGLSDKAFVACDSLKRLWRRSRPETVSMWKELEDAVRSAIENPGVTFPVRKFRVRRDGAWLRVALPSGRCLVYPSPQIVGGDITYMGINQYSRKWQRLKTYGGKLTENPCQTLAGDVLKHNMPLVEDAGYDLLFTVHDEAVTEAPDSPEYSAEHLASLVATDIEWAPGLPLAASGFEAYRYRKDD